LKAIKLSILFVIVTSYYNLNAQQLLVGKTIDSKTLKAIPLATVTNLNKGKSVLCNYKGEFAIAAEIGNLLVTTYTGYSFDTLRVVPQMLGDTSIIKMRMLANSLPNVTISAKSQYNPYQLDSIERRNEYATLLNKKNLKAIDGPVAGSGFGISFSLDRFSKREKRKRYAKEQFELMEEQAYISYIFNEKMLENYTGLSGQDLVEFINIYRPSYYWVRAHPVAEDHVIYINSKLKEYRKVSIKKLRGN
jgi:hypothetical protein